MPYTVSAVGFGVLAFAIILSSMSALTARNILHATYWLLGAAVSSAGLFYLLSADYVALMQLMVYAGAIGVLIIFTIMITLRSREDAERSIDFSPYALFVSLAFAGFIAYAIITSPSMAAELPDAVPGLAELGARLFSYENGYALPFEIASLVLTVALVAAVWWTRDGDKK